MRYYAEVSNDYIERIDDPDGNRLNDVVAICIDGYRTDEEGQVIAKVFGIKRGNEVQVFVDYHTVEARNDELTQIAIQGAISRIPSLFGVRNSTMG